MNRKKAVFNWSGGKDSAHALWKAMQSGEYDIVALLTTINRDTKLSTMHDIPMALLEEQSRSIGIPLRVVDLQPQGNMEEYNRSMGAAVEHFRAQVDPTRIGLGDIFIKFPYIVVLIVSETPYVGIGIVL